MSAMFLQTMGVMVFVAVLLALTLAYWSWRNHNEARRLHLAHRLGLRTPAEKLLLGRDRVPQPWRWLQDRLDHAGDPGTPVAVLARMVLWSLAGGLTTVWFFTGTTQFLGFLAAGVPLAILYRQAVLRTRKLSEQLPDALDRICRTLRGGHAFSDSLRLAANEVPSPAGEEFGRVSEAHRLGLDLRECLDELAHRHPGNFDVRLFVSAVLLHRDTGGNLVEILDHLASTIRERHIFRQKVVSLTAETNVSALILGALPFFLALVLIVLRPGYLVPLVTTDLGRAMLVAAACSLLTGMGAMRWFAQVEV